MCNSAKYKFKYATNEFSNSLLIVIVSRPTVDKHKRQCRDKLRTVINYFNCRYCY